MSFNSPSRVRRSSTDIPGVDQPDDSPTRSLKDIRRIAIPMVAQLDNTQQSQSTSPPSYQRRRSSPLPMPNAQSPHVPPPNPQSVSTAFLPHIEQGSEHPQSNNPSQRTPPLAFPRPVQRVPPPVLSPDNRYNSTIREDWTMSDQLLAEIERAHDASNTSANNMAGIGASSGQIQHVQIPKGPMIERDRSREKRDSPRDAEAQVGGSGGSALPRSGSLGHLTRAMQSQQAQAKSDTPPPHQTNQGQGQNQSTQRPLPTVPRGSPPYYASDAQTYAQPQSQPHSRDSSPPFRYDERSQPSKAKTPDRSLPVQEENEAEEDVTITPSSERAWERERQRQRELDIETLKPRTLTHRLPTPQFSSSPMVPKDLMQSSEPSSEELSTTVQGDDFIDHHRDAYVNDHDGRSSRAEHRFDDEEILHQQHNDEHVEMHPVQQEADDQEETESYTPKSPPSSLPQTISHINPYSIAHATDTRPLYNHHAAHLHFRPRTASSDAGGMASLDATLATHGTTTALQDTSVLYDAIDKLQSPYVSEHSRLLHPDVPNTSYNHNHQNVHNQNQNQNQTQNQNQNQNQNQSQNSYHQRPPTFEDIRSIANDVLYRQTQTRPGAPVPPTPPHNTTYSNMSYIPPFIPPSMSPPPRATPYPYSYGYPHFMQRSPDPQQMMQHMQLQHILAMQTDSTFSPSSSPYPSYDYNPFLPEHFRRRNNMDDPTMSMRSSPSHMPVSLPYFSPARKLNSKRRSVRRMRGSRELAMAIPPRGESTEPRETSPDSSDGEGEVDDRAYDEFNAVAANLEGASSSDNVSTERGGDPAGVGSSGSGKRAPVNGIVDVAEDGYGDEDDWIDEEDGDEEDDLLQLEYHPNFVINSDKRRKRWDAKWDALVKAFQALDRQTDTTMILLAAPTHKKTMYSVRSRSLRRVPALIKAPELAQLRSAFHKLSARRQAAHAQSRHMSLLEQFDRYRSPSSDGGGGGGDREEELKNVLGAALGSLSALSGIYEEREQRWRMEMGVLAEEKERVQVLLEQAFGVGLNPRAI